MAREKKQSSGSKDPCPNAYIQGPTVLTERKQHYSTVISEISNVMKKKGTGGTDEKVAFDLVFFFFFFSLAFFQPHVTGFTSRMLWRCETILNYSTSSSEHEVHFGSDKATKPKLMGFVQKCCSPSCSTEKLLQIRIGMGPDCSCGAIVILTLRGRERHDSI